METDLEISLGEEENYVTRMTEPLATLSLLCPQVSIAVGCATRNRTVPFCSTFAAFYTRAFDQIRMAAISESNINLCGSHCGVSIGELNRGQGA